MVIINLQTIIGRVVGISKATKISYAGVMCALSFVLLYLSSIVWIFVYVSPIIGGFIVMSVEHTFGRKYALSLFVSTSLLSILLLPDKEPGLVYAFFFGFYPLIAEKLDKLKPAALSFIVKLLIFNAGIFASQLFIVYVLGVPIDNDIGKWGIPLFFLLFNLLFLIYIKMYPFILYVYIKKLENRIKNIIK